MGFSRARASISRVPARRLRPVGVGRPRSCAHSVRSTGAGADTIVDFDAWDVGGQDFLDVAAFGINAGNFAARVAIIDTGADTVIRIDDTYFITLKNVSGDGDNVITQADFIFGP